MKSWQVSAPDEQPLAGSQHNRKEAKLAFGRNFEFKMPLSWLLAKPIASTGNQPATTKLRLRFSVWQNRLPVDALPLEGWIELHLLSEPELAASAF
jgi:hypothetical protein